LYRVHFGIAIKDDVPTGSPISKINP